MEAFDGFLLGLLTHVVLLVAASASAAGKAHFNHSLAAVHYCHLCDPCSSLRNQLREQTMLGAGRGSLRRGNLCHRLEPVLHAAVS